ncbi:hypothetical protein GR925_25940 [Streptomyces sp. HUCO-GS316]|uniref:hypothetical protein n=1 Tax=Streptomyces sp. HUCO-GS316 TaxID=2692198 RepID=UPI00136A7A63|nr:hypothetical protein [Streptomyces sp. HUCO-GS316]MXM66779.1 hypothetical protein [Streptomyces sp. HUCO-GS316]
MGLRDTASGYGQGLHQARDLIQPRALAVSLLRGSWVLLRLLLIAARTGMRKATSSTAAPAAAPARKGPPAKVSVTKTDAPPSDSEDADQEAGEEPPAKPRTGKVAQAARRGGDGLQNAALALVVLLVAGGFLSSLGAALLYLLRPYMTIVVTVLTLTWFLAALTADAVTRPEVDHDEDAGEYPTEEEPEDVEEEPEDVEEIPQEDPWPAQRELLRAFVEDRVTAGAAGHTKGVKGRGARLDDLLAEQQANGGLIGLDRNAFRDLLERAGITIREQMKFRVLEDTENGPKWRQKTPPGVHIEDLARDLGRTPRLPAHLVPDLTPTPARIPAQDSPPIPLPRAAGE